MARLTWQQIDKLKVRVDEMRKMLALVPNAYPKETRDLIAITHRLLVDIYSCDNGERSLRETPAILPKRKYKKKH